MMIVWGNKLYGRVDKVPGLGHIATDFGHVFWIPILPGQSHFVLSESLQQYQGIPIPMSRKSVLTAYANVVAIILILAAIGSVSSLVDPNAPAKTLPVSYFFITLGALAVPFLMWLYSPKVRYADYDMACKMAATIGDDRVRVYVDHHFGKITDQEADQRIDALEQAGFNLSEFSMPEEEESTSTYDAYANAYASASSS